MNHDAPIVQKIYDFYRDLYLAVEKMPKKDKYALGEKTQKLTLATDTKKYLHLEEQLQEIGRMLGGWLRSLKTETPTK